MPTSIIPLTIKSGKFPLNYQAETGQQFFTDMIRRMRGLVSDNDMIVGGRIGTFGNPTASLPAYDIGSVILSSLIGLDATWWFWDDATAQYQPVKRELSDGTYFTRLKALVLTDYRVATFRGTTVTKGHTFTEGTVALVENAYVPAPTALISYDGSMSIDATIPPPTLEDGFVYDRPSKTYSGKLADNATMDILTMTNGQQVTFSIKNIGTSFNLTWTICKFPAGAGGDTTIPAASEGNTAGKIIVIRKINNFRFGVVLGSFGPPPVPVVEIGGEPPHPNYGTGGQGPSAANRSKSEP